MAKEKPSKFSAKIFFIILAALLVLCAAFASTYVLANKTVYRGVECCGAELGGLTAQEAEAALRRRFGDDMAPGKIKLDLAGVKREIFTDEFGVVYSFEKTAEDAAAFGRSGNFFKRCGDAMTALFKGYNLPAAFTLDEEKLLSRVNEMLEGTGTPVTEHSFEVRDGKFFVKNGTPGDMPDSEEIMNGIKKAAGERNFDSTLEFSKKTRQPKKLTAEKLYEEAFSAVCDASYKKEGSTVVVVPHKYGIDFNKKEAEDIIKQHTEYGEEFQIPAKIEAPSLLYEDAKAKLFAQTLGSYKSNFNSGDRSRSSNIYLAAKLINDVILMPGDVFSYNDTVGERSAARGFKVAHVYMNNEVVDGIGGGICQVSSTLYCATLYANMEIVTRTNHQLPVSYVPLGQDATVDYGNIDFKFKNNTGYPLKVAAEGAGATVTVSILGYRDNTEKVEVTPVRISTISPAVTEEPDPTLPRGERKIVKKGADGCVVETYKTVTVNGVKGARTLTSKSTYSATKTLVRVGTKPPAAASSAVETVTDDAKEQTNGEDALKPSESPAPTGSASASPSAAPKSTETKPAKETKAAKETKPAKVQEQGVE